MNATPPVPAQLQSRPPSVTLNDVAARCGVSYQTVSRVANGSRFVAEETRTRVLQAIHDLGYRPNMAARRLATRRSGVIGMVASDITYYGPAQLMVSIEETARRHDYSLMFVGIDRSSDTQLEAAIDHLCKHQVDGLVVGANIEGKVELVQRLCRGVPFVTLDRTTPTTVPAAVVDQSLGVRLSIKHLLELGHRQIASVAGPSGWPAAVERRNAFVRALKRARVEPGLIVEGDWSAESGYAATIRLLGLGRKAFSAIVAANDQMALGVMRALHHKRVKVPQEVSVVGYDDLPESEFFEPPLTTIHNDFARQGELCFEMLLRLINQEAINRPLELLQPELVVRNSTAGVTS
ncbi:MAG: LacI family DNA-binding transcriptional regulator [Verrucomicrobia bacterium]|nr:LacI family DNA-binding transcriptional regulator [Verrucomicrobiota bacterium]